MGLIAFDTNGIADIAAQTIARQQQWDDIWSSVKSRIGATVAGDLDALTGMSLEERSAAYAAKTAQYTIQLQAQAQATAKIGSIAAETNQAMARVIAG
ncbi:hypothetical protein CLV47_12237 [Antricoccus suffuscus]|uniref:Uncharacterized protein n=1 Tax=Antricoccus suffuscus TaxID=1629062 RepID=A0A2T0ZFW4_9ACTN|nr:hypothetical protein [Antricoccus suffuscus]PRZ35217.1 hypothetical protein CLV47_12237 [Antricoccus suffuscus]